MRLSAKSIFLRKIGRWWTSSDTLPMSGGQGVRLRHGTHMADQAGGATKIIGIKITERVLLGVVG
jgi:hypothetical protein